MARVAQIVCDLTNQPVAEQDAVKFNLTAEIGGKHYRVRQGELAPDIAESLQSTFAPVEEKPLSDKEKAEREKAKEERRRRREEKNRQLENATENVLPEPGSTF